MSNNMSEHDKDALIAELQQRVAGLEAKLLGKDRELEENTDWWNKRYNLINLIAREWKEKAERPEQAARVAGRYSGSAKWVRWVKSSYPEIFERAVAELINSDELMLRLMGQDVAAGQRLWIMHDILLTDPELKALREDRKRQHTAERVKRLRLKRSSTLSVTADQDAELKSTE